MKNKWGIIAIIVLLFGILLFFLLRNKEHVSHDVKEPIQQNLSSTKDSSKTQSLTIESIDSVNSYEKVEIPKPSKLKGQNVTFKVSGALRKGEIPWKEGTKFHFNDFICKIDETKLFLQIAEKKERLLEEGRGFMQDCFQQLPDLASKWETYFSAIDQGNRMPSFPILEEDKSLVTKHALLDLHNSAMNLEDQIGDYYFLAPFDGKILSIRKSIGSRVKAGEVVMVIQEGF